MIFKNNKLLRTYTISIILYFIESGVDINSNESIDFLVRKLDMRYVRTYLKLVREKGYVDFDDVSGTYSISSKGDEYLEKNRLLIEFFEYASPYFTLEEFYFAAKESGEKNFNVIMIGMFNELLRSIRGTEKYLSQRNIYEELGELYYKSDNIKEGVKQYTSSLYIYASGILFLGDVDNYINGGITKNELTNSIPNFRVSDIMINNLKKGKNYISNELISEIEAVHNMRIRMCSRDDFLKLISDILNDKYDAIYWKNIYNNKFKKIVGKAETYKVSINN